MAEPHRVRDALRASMTAWATLTVRDDQARVTLAPDLDVLAPQLDAIDPGWSLTWACDHPAPPIVRARLSVLGAAREGLATGHTLQDAKLAALADLARSYGVTPTSDPVWVEYDPEDGANTSELETDTPTPRPAEAAIRDKIAELWTEAQVCRLMTMRSMSIVEHGGKFSYEGAEIGRAHV